MNNPFDYIPDRDCEAAFGELLARIARLKESGEPHDVRFCRELESGKMLGILVAADGSGARHTLFAFSGQIGEGGFRHPGFVGPVFDYLQPEGYFKTKEAEISRRNADIALMQKEMERLSAELDSAKAEADRAVAAFRERCRLSKESRERKRLSDTLGEEEKAELIRQSQFEKAELHRLKKRTTSELAPLSAELEEARARLRTMKEERKAESERLQAWLFKEFKVLNALGEERSLGEIFAGTTAGIPPSGAGECCAPKLLQAAYLRGWTPLSIAEYWYGRPKSGEVRRHGEHYPACRGKCLPVLSWMLQGLTVEPPLDSSLIEERTYEPKILFENEWFCVVDKPSGMLSVPGKGRAVSVLEWLEAKFGPTPAGKRGQVKAVHRLDRDTSGLLVFAFGEQAHKTLQGLFAQRKVSKTYVADLEGDYRTHGLPRTGTVSLPLSPDVYDRPRQKVDPEGGKLAETQYEFTEATSTHSRVIFRPLTGRTHQLRVHAASAQGLGMPILGDTLYGHRQPAAPPSVTADRLHLHAHRLEFDFPLDNRPYTFISPLPF